MFGQLTEIMSSVSLSLKQADNPYPRTGVAIPDVPFQPLAYTPCLINVCHLLRKGKIEFSLQGRGWERPKIEGQGFQDNICFCLIFTWERWLFFYELPIFSLTSYKLSWGNQFSCHIMLSKHSWIVYACICIHTHTEQGRKTLQTSTHRWVLWILAPCQPCFPHLLIQRARTVLK